MLPSFLFMASHIPDRPTSCPLRVVISIWNTCYYLLILSPSRTQAGELLLGRVLEYKYGKGSTGLLKPSGPTEAQSVELMSLG